MIYVRCVDGPMKGRHVWIAQGARTYMFQSASFKKASTSYRDPRAMAKLTAVKEHVYYLREHIFSDGFTRTRVFYLHTKYQRPMNDVIEFFGPKMT